MGSKLKTKVLNLTEDHIQELLHDSKYERALTEIVSAFHEPMYWVIRKLVLRHEDANDVLQNTYVRIFKGLPKFRHQSAVKTWCYRIAYNESMRHLEQQKKRGLLLPDGNFPDYWAQLCADPYFDAHQADAHFQQLLGELTEDQRMVFSMKYYDELKFTEIAAVTGRNVNAIKATYYAAKTALTQQLKTAV